MPPWNASRHCSNLRKFRSRAKPNSTALLVERYVPGAEVAVEGLMTRGRLRILAIFDKPDPLEGPYFEETIYVTPSRLPEEMQERIADCAAATVRALGLTHGPVHAEFRVNEQGPWVLEASPRPIGGLCSRALRFGPERILLEELLVRHALGLPGSDLDREDDASGVMMIPVPKTGVCAALRAKPKRGAAGVSDIQITARLHDFIAAWPEGSSYLGFIFARGKSPAEVEAALRPAHGNLKFEISDGCRWSIPRRELCRPRALSVNPWPSAERSPGQLRAFAEEELLHLFFHDLLRLRIERIQPVLVHQHLGVLDPHFPALPATHFRRRACRVRPSRERAPGPANPCRISRNGRCARRALPVSVKAPDLSVRRNRLP